VVIPSNRALSQRAHGMAESTLRRHLAALSAAGLILRHDSPNGKRYAARGRDGAVLRAFGFDLRPLLVRAEEIGAAARAAEEARDRLRQLREKVVLRVRDAGKLLDYGRAAGLDLDWTPSRHGCTTCASSFAASRTRRF
jgi:replication initiation protein RepC